MAIYSFSRKEGKRDGRKKGKRKGRMEGSKEKREKRKRKKKKKKMKKKKKRKKRKKKKKHCTRILKRSTPQCSWRADGGGCLESIVREAARFRLSSFI